VSAGRRVPLGASPVGGCEILGAAMSQEPLHAIVDRARETFSAQACSILVHEPESRSLVFAAMSGEGAESVEGSESLVGVRIPDGAGVAGWVLARREPLLLEDVAHDRRFAEPIAETIGYVPRRMMAAPLLLDDRVLGVLEVLDAPEQAKWAESGHLGAFAEEAARAVAGRGQAE
jgi:GAF domain-containing protein